MKLSELISKLEALKEKYGDADIFTSDNNRRRYSNPCAFYSRDVLGSKNYFLIK